MWQPVVILQCRQKLVGAAAGVPEAWRGPGGHLASMALSGGSGREKEPQNQNQGKLADRNTRIKTNILSTKNKEDKEDLRFRGTC